MRSTIIRSFFSIALALSLVPPAFAIQDPASMSADQKKAKAKSLFQEGNAAMEAGDYNTALSKYEQAYGTYAPNLHIFNFNIGSAAKAGGDCVKAKQAFQRFLDLVPEHQERKTAQEAIAEMERSGCGQAPASAALAPSTPAVTDEESAPIGPVAAEDEESPILRSRRSEREDAAEKEYQKRESKQVSRLMLTGIVLGSVGFLGVVAGFVAGGLAYRDAKTLANLSGAGPSGFPNGSYADEKTFEIDQRRQDLNLIAPIALAGGAALLATGVALMIVDRKKRGKRSKRAASSDAELTGIVPTVLPSGGGAAATFRF